MALKSKVLVLGFSFLAECNINVTFGFFPAWLCALSKLCSIMSLRVNSVCQLCIHCQRKQMVHITVGVIFTLLLSKCSEDIMHV